MADIGQATFIGSDIITQCDENWSYCQREQAKAKTDNLDKKCPLTIRKSVNKMSRMAKKNCCARETGRFIREMTANPDAASRKNTASPCLAEKVKDDWRVRKIEAESRWWVGCCERAWGESRASRRAQSSLGGDGSLLLPAGDDLPGESERSEGAV